MNRRKLGVTKTDRSSSKTRSKAVLTRDNRLIKVENRRLKGQISRILRIIMENEEISELHG